MLDLTVLREAKKKQRISYKELEEITGISKTDICKICNAQCITVNLSKVDAIRAALGLKREALLIRGQEPKLKNKEVLKGQLKLK